MDPGARVEVTMKDREGRSLSAIVAFYGGAGEVETSVAENSQLVQRGLAPGPYTMRLEPERNGGRRMHVARVPGSVPPLVRFDDIDPTFARSVPRERTGDEHTFQHVPAGRATVFVIDSDDSLRVHREELDVPESGTLSRDVTPVWQELLRGDD
jgi:hypothetical protein